MIEVRKLVIQGTFSFFFEYDESRVRGDVWHRQCDNKQAVFALQVARDGAGTECVPTLPSTILLHRESAFLDTGES